METQVIQIAHNLSFKKSSAKHIVIIRVLFNKEFTKIDFGFDSNRIQYINGDQILVSPDVFLKTRTEEYQLISARIFKKPFFQIDKDYQYFSMLFEAIDEDIDGFDIIDNFDSKKLLPFGFKNVCFE